MTRIKQAELLSAAGAAVMGAGVGLLLERWLRDWAVALVLVGVAAHAFGMFRKRSLEISDAQPGGRLAEALYWLCWACLGVLVAAIIASR